MNKWLKVIICLIVFIVSMGLLIKGQKSIGPQHLGVMLIGLVGVLSLLFVYNKSYR